VHADFQQCDSIETKAELVPPSGTLLDKDVSTVLLCGGFTVISPVTRLAACKTLLRAITFGGLHGAITLAALKGLLAQVWIM
jgi:hypothetical protein